MKIDINDIIKLCKEMDKLSLLSILNLVVLELTNKEIKQNVKIPCPHSLSDECGCPDKFI